MHNAIATLAITVFAITGLTITTFLPVNSSPGSRQRVPDLVGPSSRRDGPSELERAARRGACRLLLVILVALEGPPAVRLLLIFVVTVMYRITGARERVADLVRAGLRCDAAC